MKCAKPFRSGLGLFLVILVIIVIFIVVFAVLHPFARFCSGNVARRLSGGLIAFYNILVPSGAMFKNTCLVRSHSLRFENGFVLVIAFAPVVFLWLRVFDTSCLHMQFTYLVNKTNTATQRIKPTLVADFFCSPPVAALVVETTLSTSTAHTNTLELEVSQNLVCY